VAIDDLLRTLTDEAEHRATALLEGARTEAARLVAEAEEARARLGAEFLERREAELRRAADRVVAGARRTAAATLLAARESALDRIFQRAEALLLSRAPGAAARACDSAHLQAALDALGGGAAVVHCAPEDVASVRAQLNGMGGIAVVADQSVGVGVRVSSEDGTVTADAQALTLLERRRPEISVELARLLAEEP
jgi:vacuolar-type H+-ATPase subunit E/Vma4